MLTVQLYRGDNQLRASLSCVDLQCRLIICCHLPDEFNSCHVCQAAKKDGGQGFAGIQYVWSQ